MDKGHAELGLDNPPSEWSEGGFVLEAVTGWFQNVDDGDEPCTTIHLMGGQTMTVDLSVDELVSHLINENDTKIEEEE